MGQAPRSPSPGGKPVQNLCSKAATHGSRDPSQDPAPCHQKSLSLKKKKKSLDTLGGFLSCSGVAPPEASRLSPTELWSCSSQSSRSLRIHYGFFWPDALRPVTAGTKPDLATAPSPPFPTAHFGRMLTRAALSFQHPWSCPTFPPARSLLSIPLGISAEAVPRRGASVNTQGRWRDALSPSTTAAVAFPSHLCLHGAVWDVSW